MVQCPEIGSPTSEAQASRQARSPRPCQPHGWRMGKSERNQVSGPWMVADLGMGLHSSTSAVGVANPGASGRWFWKERP